MTHDPTSSRTAIDCKRCCYDAGRNSPTTLFTSHTVLIPQRTDSLASAVGSKLHERLVSTPATTTPSNGSHTTPPSSYASVAWAAEQLSSSRSELDAAVTYGCTFLATKVGAGRRWIRCPACPPSHHPRPQLFMYVEPSVPPLFTDRCCIPPALYRPPRAGHFLGSASRVAGAAVPPPLLRPPHRCRPAGRNQHGASPAWVQSVGLWLTLSRIYKL